MRIHSRTDCEALDASDPLKEVVADFIDGDAGVLYFDANSIGAMPARAQAAMDRMSAEWRRLRRRGWSDSDWLDAPSRLGDKLAPIVGAEPGSVVVCDSTSINLHKAVAMAVGLRPGRREAVTEAATFPTDLYVTEDVTCRTGLKLRHARTPEEIGSLMGPDTAVLLLSHTDYRTSYRHALPALTRTAHAAGAVVVWDLSHSAGAVPCGLAAAEADFAVGCGYKYLCGGPGAPAWLYVAPRHQEVVAPALPGWMGHADPMSFAPDYQPAPGVRRHLVGTPSVVANALMEAALDLWQAIQPTVAFEKHAALGNALIELMAQRNDPGGLELASPAHADRRGGFVAFRHHAAKSLDERLEQTGVVASYRPPDIVRFGLSPLYHRFTDIWDLADRIGRVLD